MYLLYFTFLDCFDFVMGVYVYVYVYIQLHFLLLL